MVKKDCINSSKEHANRASALFSEQKKRNSQAIQHQTARLKASKSVQKRMHKHAADKLML